MGTSNVTVGVNYIPVPRALLCGRKSDRDGACSTRRQTASAGRARDGKIAGGCDAANVERGWPRILQCRGLGLTRLTDRSIRKS